MKALVPEAPLPLLKEVVDLIQRIRGMDVLKKPSIRATVDWVRSLLTLGEAEPKEEVLIQTLGVVVKSPEDRKKVEGHLFKLEGRLYE